MVWSLARVSVPIGMIRAHCPQNEGSLRWRDRCEWSPRSGLSRLEPGQPPGRQLLACGDHAHGQPARGQPQGQCGRASPTCPCSGIYHEPHTPGPDPVRSSAGCGCRSRGCWPKWRRKVADRWSCCRRRLGWPCPFHCLITHPSRNAHRNQSRNKSDPMNESRQLSPSGPRPFQVTKVISKVGSGNDSKGYRPNHEVSRCSGQCHLAGYIQDFDHFFFCEGCFLKI